VLPAAAMHAAWAAQPYVPAAFVEEVRRLLALAEVRVPHVLDDLVVGVRQGFLALGIEPYTVRCHSTAVTRLGGPSHYGHEPHT